MRNVERDYTLIAQVPDHVSLEDCEIVIHKASISYPDSDRQNILVFRYDDETGKDDVGIEVLSTRFVDPDTGQELESD